jgi:hypothetical protein
MQAEVARQAWQALEEAGEALVRLPDAKVFPHSSDGFDRFKTALAEWRKAHRRPALYSIMDAQDAVRAEARRPPTPPAITVSCPDPDAHRSSPMWSPEAAAFRPRRPSPAMVRQVAVALAEVLPRPIRPVDMEAALRGALSCSRNSARRALRDALTLGLVVVDAQNHIRPNSLPPAGLVPGQAQAHA